MAEHKTGSKLTANILSGAFFLVVAAGLYYGARPLSMGTNFSPDPAICRRSSRH